MLTLHANVNDLPEALRRLWTARDAGGAWRLALELPDEEQTEATLSLLVTAAVDGDAYPELRTLLMTLSLDMGAFLRSGAVGMEWDSAFEAVFETVIPDGLSQGAGNYGGSLGQFTFVISIPDASVTSNLNPQASYSA